MGGAWARGQVQTCPEGRPRRCGLGLPARGRGTLSRGSHAHQQAPLHLSGGSFCPPRRRHLVSAGLSGLRLGGGQETGWGGPARWPVALSALRNVFTGTECVGPGWRWKAASAPLCPSNVDRRAEVKPRRDPRVQGQCTHVCTCVRLCMHMVTHTYTHTRTSVQTPTHAHRIGTHMHTHLCTHPHMQMRTHIHAHTCIYTQAHVCARVHIHACACRHTYTYSSACMYIDLYGHARTHAHIHTLRHTCTHVHACVHAYCCILTTRANTHT